MSTYSGRFAKRLKDLRDKAGLSVAETVGILAKGGVKISDVTYYSWESGRTEPKIDHFPVLAKTFGSPSPQDLLPPK